MFVCVVKKYDLTLLTRKRNINPLVPPVIKGSSLHYIKNAFEHLGDISDAPRIAFILGIEIHCLGAKIWDYEKELYQQVIECDPTFTLAKTNFAGCLWSMGKYHESLDLITNGIKETPNDVWLLSTAIKRYRDSCQQHMDKKLNKKGYGLTADERIGKAIEYGHKLLNLVYNDGKWIKKTMYPAYGSLLFAWSKDFKTNREEQRTALKMYETLIQWDQQFGYDVIKNWIRDLDRFEIELTNIIVEYWYLPDRSMHKCILNCVDLIQTYFNQDEEKMRRSKILSCIAPYGYIRKCKDTTNNTMTEWCYVSIKKPWLYDKIGSTGGSRSFLRTPVASWYSDTGGALTNDEQISLNGPTTKFSVSFAAKLAYFFAFWQNYKNFINNELGLTINLIKKLRIVMVRLLIHYVFKMEKTNHENFMAMIQDSTKMTNIVKEINSLVSLTELGAICENIEKNIDLEDEKVISNMRAIVTPYIVTKNQR